MKSYFFTILPLLRAWFGLSIAHAASAGSVVAWGDTNYGQTITPGAAQSGVAAIAAGRFHTVALKTNGCVVAWGAGTNSTGTTWPNAGQAIVPVAAQSGVVAIAAANAYTVALKNDGSVVAWGSNTSGQTNVPLAAQSGVVAVVAGYVHSGALKHDGSVVMWGSDSSGQIAVPAGLRGVTAIAAGGYHTVVLLGGPVPLSAQRIGNDMVIAWSAYGSGFTLQSTPVLTPPVLWVDVTNPPVLLGGEWTVTNTFSGSAQYFRLRTP